jgi:hypothetical protein
MLSKTTVRSLIKLNACHFAAVGWNCKTHRQALQGFPDTSQVSLHKNNKINLFKDSSSAGIREVTVAFNFISERSVFIIIITGSTALCGPWPLQKPPPFFPI